MEKLVGLKLGGKLTQIGDITEYENEEIKVKTITRHKDPAHLESSVIRQIYKLDFEVKVFTETITDARIIKYTSCAGRGDELFYIVSGTNIFHGDPIWTKMHPFAKEIKFENEERLELSVNEDLDKDTLEGNYLFVGGRNNFTHQIIDSYSLYAWHRLNKDAEHKLLDGVIIGEMNGIVAFCKEADQYWNESQIKTISIKSEKSSTQQWNSSITRVQKLQLVKHLSIFTAFKSVKEGMGITKAFKELGIRNIKSINVLAERSSNYNKVGFLAREDSRILNQSEISSQLRRMGVDIIEGIKGYNVIERVKLISKYDIIISPPGSDNINAALFSRDDCLLIYMQSSIPSNTTTNPYYTLAGYRYYLPVLQRTLFWQASKQQDMHSGEWSIKELIGMLASYGIRSLRSFEQDSKI